MKHSFKRGFWINHIIWLITFGLFFITTNYFQPTNFALMAAAYNTFIIFLVYVITIKFLFPRYYEKGKGYILISVAVIFGLSTIFAIIDIYFLPDLKHNIPKKPPIFFIFMRYVMTLGLAFFIGNSVSLMRYFTRQKEAEKILIKEKLETELKLLKAQINPHFIFNALNNIYSLSYSQSKNAPDSILKLSEMLRYVFYDCSKDRVPLSAEIKYIENFNAFQQMKSEFVQNIKLQVENSLGNIEIAPMLIIPFLENAYKYSRIEANEDAFVNIRINSVDGKLNFRIENSTPKESQSAPGSGMGIKNVKHRLAIIYPGKHELSIEEENNVFKVGLQLEST